ncbi:TIR domain-containing protein [Rhodopseudomonas palustris]|uniref:TIR domain-containing protein n=1 Tax=Rhodopseudomonas palustris TaxID=1076 RepID=UPI0009B9E80B|nr:TIR domain-containing protein [Rhodopseudomonas palustris]
MAKSSNKVAKAAEKRTNLSQSDFPSATLRDALRLPRALIENYAGGPAAPHDVALAIELSPTSSQWRMLAGCALAYGLTTGSFSADRIGVSDLGRRIIAPTTEGDDFSASVEAIMKPRIQREFFQKYDKNKFPREEIAKNVLAQLGIPRDRIDSCLNILIENGKEHRIVRETKTGLFVAVESTSRRHQQNPLEEDEPEATNVLPIPLDSKAATAAALNNRVFISHGKNRKILEQLKTVISYGNFEPVVSIDNETASKPIPDKVLDDMRSSAFAVIHIEDEKTLLDEAGEKHVYLNQNVLVEIGAAMALHKGRFVLLVKEGVQLPSNLQGLYQCRYSGDTLDFDATMRLLKAFNDFRGKV